MNDFPHTVPGWLTEREGKRLAELATGRVVLEIGSWRGRSTICLARTSEHVFALDTFAGDKDTGPRDTLRECADNLTRFGVRHKVSLLVGRSDGIGPVLRGPFGMVFVDASHDTFDVEHDSRLAVRLTGPGGVIVWHDWHMPGVRFGIERALDGSPGAVEDNLYVWER